MDKHVGIIDGLRRKDMGSGRVKHVKARRTKKEKKEGHDI